MTPHPALGSAQHQALSDSPVIGRDAGSSAQVAPLVLEVHAGSFGQAGLAQALDGCPAALAAGFHALQQSLRLLWCPAGTQASVGQQYTGTKELEGGS